MGTWKKDAAEKRIAARLEEVAEVEVKEYVRDTDLTDLPRATAYRVHGVHIYIDILNLSEMLGITGDEGVTCHRRTLRFLNLHYRAVHRILTEVDAIQVDFHNQRLHAVVAKPYDDETKRIHRAVAISQLVIDVLKHVHEEGDDPLPAAKVRVGIDSGSALAVNNGRRGHREPLFLGSPANLAAKRACGGSSAGIFLTNTTRQVAGFSTVSNEDASALTSTEVATSTKNANLAVTVDGVLKEWSKDLENNPIRKFEFSCHTPPFNTLDLENLSPGNSRRQDALSLYADIDNFTAYVSANISTDEGAKNVVRALHVLRSEMDCVLDTDFAGRKIRFIGDCVHGVMAEGTAAATDAHKSINTAVFCAGALRSSFQLAISLLKAHGVEATGLGLAIGLEYGPIAITRLGVRGEMIRCCISRGVLASEAEQKRCTGKQTAIGPALKAKAPSAIVQLFGDDRRAAGLTYDYVSSELGKSAQSRKQDQSLGTLLRPASSASNTTFAFPATAAGQSSKPKGFA